MSRDWIPLAVKQGTSLHPHRASGSSGRQRGSRGGGGRGRHVRSPPVLPATQVLAPASQSDLTPVPMAAAAAAALRECAGSRGSRAETDLGRREGSLSLLWRCPDASLGADSGWASLVPGSPTTCPWGCQTIQGGRVSTPGPGDSVSKPPRVQPRCLTPTSQHTGGPARVRAFPGTAVLLPTTGTSTSTGLSWGLSGCCLPRQACTQADPALVAWRRPYTLAYTWSPCSYLKGANIS